MVLNARSLARPNAIQQLAVDVNSCSPDIICVSETWLKTKHNPDDFSLNGYKCFRMDRSKRRGGGICIYTREKLNALCVEPLHNAGKFELMFVEVSASDTLSTKYCICLCYHPPKSAYRVHELIENLTANLSHFADTGNYDVIVFTGDLNSLKCDDLMESLGLTQIVDKPTRANRTLDVLYTNRPDLLQLLSHAHW